MVVEEVVIVVAVEWLGVAVIMFAYTSSSSSSHPTNKDFHIVRTFSLLDGSELNSPRSSYLGWTW